MPKDRYCNYLEIFEWIENGTSLLVRLVRVQVCQTHWMGIDRISAFSAYGAADGFVTGLLYNIQVLNINIAFNWKRYHKDKELYFWFGHQNSTVKDDQHYHLKRLILILLRSLEVVQYERFTIHHHHHQPGKVFSANNTVPILHCCFTHLPQQCSWNPHRFSDTHHWKVVWVMKLKWKLSKNLWWWLVGG